MCQPPSNGGGGVVSVKAVDLLNADAESSPCSGVHTDGLKQAFHAASS